MDRRFRDVILVLLLVTGLCAGCQFASDAVPGAPTPSENPPFRSYFWQERSLDLWAQAGLILCGALGIAALLPRPGEEDPE